MPVVGIRRDIEWREAFVNATGAYYSYVERTLHQQPDFAPLSRGGSAGREDGFRAVGALEIGAFAWVATPQAAAAGALAMLAGAIYWLWPALKAGPLALFSRVRGEDLLKNPLRAEIHQRIEAEPGLHHQALVRALGRAHGTVEHHLRKLVEGGLVARVQGKGYTCYFPKGRLDYRAMAAAPFLKSPVARSILDNVRRKPGIRTGELARALAVAPATIHYHVERLRGAGLIDGALAHGAMRLTATEAGTAV
ncbi:MAG: winged helix-turn-helix transcriptional regulator [Thermoplasmatota archaeon]|nr:helix-turn-helix domain-containing protein [Halobacteriales archaeon]